MWLHQCTLQTDDIAQIDSLNATGKLQFVCQVFKLFHMTEFLFLVEFTVVPVPMIYGLCAASVRSHCDRSAHFQL